MSKLEEIEKAVLALSEEDRAKFRAWFEEMQEQLFDEQIERVQNDLISQRELEKAHKQARALFAYSTERVTMQAFWLAFAENFHSYEWFEQYVKRLEAVTNLSFGLSTKMFSDTPLPSLSNW